MVRSLWDHGIKRKFLSVWILCWTSHVHTTLTASQNLVKSWYCDPWVWVLELHMIQMILLSLIWTGDNSRWLMENSSCASLEDRGQVPWEDTSGRPLGSSDAGASATGALCTVGPWPSPLRWRPPDAVWCHQQTLLCFIPLGSPITAVFKPSST